MYVSFPNLGVKTTCAFLHALVEQPRAKLALTITNIDGPRMGSGPGNIPENTINTGRSKRPK